MADGAVFDSAFKTMMHKLPLLVIPFVNEAFGRDYPKDTPVVQLATEHETPSGRRYADAAMMIGGRTYHIECQSTPDAGMAVRMLEYDLAIALDQSLVSTDAEVEMPASCVLYLRDSPDFPDEIKLRVRLPDGDSFTYRSIVLRAHSYAAEEIFGGRMLILAPFYLLRYEHELDAIEGDVERREALLAECARLREQLEERTGDAEDASLCEELIGLIIRVSDHVLRAHGALQREVRQAMGGEVWELMSERTERLEREAREAREQGMERGIEQFAAALRERGVDEALLAQASAALQA